MGRPSSFKAEYVEQAEKLCKLGATDVELADFFEVSVATLYRWKNEFPEFCDALKSGKEVADERVERSLYHRATGYTFDSVHFSSFQGQVTATPYREHVPPDTTAMIFWLKNRRSAEWRDRTEHVVKREQEWTDEQLDARIRQVTGQIAAEGGTSVAAGREAATTRAKSLN